MTLIPSWSELNNTTHKKIQAFLSPSAHWLDLLRTVKSRLQNSRWKTTLKWTKVTQVSLRQVLHFSPLNTRDKSRQAANTKDLNCCSHPELRKRYKILPTILSHLSVLEGRRRDPASFAGSHDVWSLTESSLDLIKNCEQIINPTGMFGFDWTLEGVLVRVCRWLQSVWQIMSSVIRRQLLSFCGWSSIRSSCINLPKPVC